MNILVTGANGQLGSEIKELADGYSSHKFFFTNSDTLDITSKEKVFTYIKDYKINGVVNCAAFTAVDKAESNAELAEDVNSKGVENILLALEEVKGKLIHISTDYVFNGENFVPYKENQEVNPIGVYGITKRRGEKKVVNSSLEALVIRTSWVYSSHGNNFVKTMLRLGKERSELGVVYDQIGSPTYAKDLAKVCLQIITSDVKIDSKSKLYHFSNEGVASWYDFAKAIFEISEIDCKVNPIETKEYPTPAKRPHYSVLNKAKIKKDFDVEIPYWKDSLIECIKKIKE